MDGFSMVVWVDNLKFIVSKKFERQRTMRLLLTCATELPVGGIKYPLSSLPKHDKGGFCSLPKPEKGGLSAFPSLIKADSHITSSH
jgi:hypothetical protein